MKDIKKITKSSRALELERRRIRAVQKVLDGIKATEVAKEFGVTRGAVSQWLATYYKEGWEGLNSKNKPGQPIRFTENHSKQLFSIISKSPIKWNYDSDLWTVRMVRDILYEQTGDYFSNTRVLSELHNLGFSFQKPQINPLEKKTKKQKSGWRQYIPKY